MDNTTNLAGIIKFHRKKAGLTQKGLADLSGVGKTVIFDLEKGKTSVQFDTIQKVLKVLNVKINFESPIMNLIRVQNENNEDL
ncbi:MAG: helix-turn-helix domain-containing protein [bacterium]